MATGSRLGTGVIAAAALLLGASAYATTAAQKCQEQKLKALGKLGLCLEKNAARIVAGKPDASATCQMKFQSALTKAGTACRYLDNGDGTVSDLDTGLQWEKKDNLDSTANLADPHDADNYYDWSTSGSAPDGTAYTDLLSQLNDGASTDGEVGTPITGCFAGHCDWRLPTIVELQGIVATQGNCGGGSGPCIDAILGPTQAFYYWSATSDAGNPAFAWSVTFYSGGVYSTRKTDFIAVRAVRGGL